MPTYLVLHELTRKGAERIENGREHLEQSKALATEMDCRVRSVYLTNGQYDVAVILEAPDDLTAKRLAMAVTSEGRVTTEIVRAFTEDEFADVVAELPE